MRHVFLLFMLCSGSISFAQQTQWQSGFVDSAGHYDNRVFMETLGNRQMAAVYLQKQPDQKPKLLLALLDECGNAFTSHLIEGTGFTPRWINDLVHDVNGNLYICGLTDSVMPHGKLFVIKITPQLNIQWTKVYTGAYGIYPYTFNVNEDNELFILFNTLESQHGNGLLKLNTNGQLVSARSFGYSPIWGRGGPTSDGGFIHSTGSIVYKTNSTGNMLWRTLIRTGHMVTPPVEIDGGFVFFQGYPGAMSRNRVVMLNGDGSLRWISQEFDGFNGKRVKKVNNNELVFVGFGSSTHPTAPSDQGVCFMSINTSGQISSTMLLHSGGEELLYNGFDFATAPSGDGFLVEKKQISPTSESKIVFTRIPESPDSLTCYSSYPFEDGRNALVNDSILPVLQSKSMPFSTSSLSLSVSSQQVQKLEYACQKIQKGVPFDLGPDTLLCPGQIIGLSGPPGYRYQWRHGPTTQSITVDQGGWYTLEAQYGCDTTAYTDSVFIDYYPQIALDILLNGERFYVGDTVRAKAIGGMGTAYTWFLNDVQVGTDSVLIYLAQNPGRYTLRIEYNTGNPCTYSKALTFEVILKTPKVPNVFTPNGDGRNDIFKLQQAESQPYTMEIYNRFGRLVQRTDQRGWDGNTGLNRPAAEGVYFYVIHWQNGVAPFKGHLTLLR